MKRKYAMKTFISLAWIIMFVTLNNGYTQTASRTFLYPDYVPERLTLVTLDIPGKGLCNIKESPLAGWEVSQGNRTKFTTLSRMGGDNYQEMATVHEQSMLSEVMTVWRNVYIEYDVMEDTPMGYDDWGQSRSHSIHPNYLFGKEHGLAAILEAFNDGEHQKNRNTYITPIITPNSDPETRTPFRETFRGVTSRDYHLQTREDKTMLHLISAHRWKQAPEKNKVGGVGDLQFLYIFWDNLQRGMPDIDSGKLEDVWIIAYEFGHYMGRLHHVEHGLDDIAGLPGHDCIMTQAPGLNKNGQTTKRFGPACVRAMRKRTLVAASFR